MAPDSLETRSPAQRAGRPALHAFGCVIWIGFVVWLIDAASLFSAAPQHLQPTLIGLFVGLFFAQSACVAFGLVVAAMVAIAARPAAQRGTPALAARVRAYLSPGDPAERVLRSGALLAWPPLLLVYAAGSFVVGQRLIVGMARPELTALALLALHLLLSLLVAALYPVFASLGSWLALALGRVPRIGSRVFGGPLAVALWLAALGVAALASFVIVYSQPLSYLPWHEISQAVAALVVASLATWLGLRGKRLAAALYWGLPAACVLAATLAAASLTPEHMFARRVAETRVLSGRIGHAVLTLAFDADHDGYLPVLGGGDCAPFDPAKNPSAIDVPDNGIDEDCDGHDLQAGTLPRMGNYRHPVRADVPRRPPIVLITVDAFAATRMRAFGGTRNVTPNLDAFAQRSVLFQGCFSQGPSTRLSFPAIFTSRWDSQIRTRLSGKHPFPIDASELLLAEMLRDAGYDTSAVLSDGYFARSRWSGLTSGFSHVIDSPYQDRPALPHNGPRVTEAAVAELTRARTEPLFLWVHYYDAHSPHTQPEDVPVFGKERSDVYDGELNLVDREVGKLLEAIETELHGQALVIVTGDHAIAFDAPRHETFNYGYDLSTAVLHVPLIVHAPFLSAHSVGGVVSTMDIAPTLANILRLRGPLPFQGQSLVPELFDNKRVRPQLLFHEMFLEERLWKNEEPLERASVRTDRFNLLHDRKGGFFELYDYRNDPLEKHDLATDPRYEHTLRELRNRLMLFTYITQRNDTKAARPRPVPKPKAAVAVAPPMPLAPAAVPPRVPPSAAPPPRAPADDEEP